MLNYVVSEQKNPDWVFKSSYIYIKEDNIPLSQDQLYVPDQITNIIDYITDAKPYHTQIRDYASTYITSDIAQGTALDRFHWNINLEFGPMGTGFWDTDPWDIYPWDNWSQPYPYYILNAETFADNIQQFVSQENVYTVPLTFFDVSKKGYSQLYPYTFNILTLNDPQTFITPADIVGVQIGTTVLIAGQDFYVEYNSIDATYTVYFYNDPGTSPVPVALVWFDGGELSNLGFNGHNNELYLGAASTDLVINVDTKLPVNVTVIGPPVYSAITDMWDYFDPVINNIITGQGGQPMGFDTGYWDEAVIPLDPLSPVIVLLNNTISYKENINQDSTSFYRNADFYSGILVLDLPAPTEQTYNLDVITVTIDPSTHPLGTDILPNPGINPGVIWINGERIEYRDKQLTTANTWELRLIARGTMGTAVTNHLALTKVWIEAGNFMPIDSNIGIWNAVDPSPNLAGTDVTSVPLGGLWYAQTPEAIFLKAEQGISIP
jgi:hypothetical protein